MISASDVSNQEGNIQMLQARRKTQIPGLKMKQFYLHTMLQEILMKMRK